MAIRIEEIYRSTYEHYKQAKENMLSKHQLSHRDGAISDAIPGFQSSKLEFGSYDRENFAVLFVDMRNSTKRAVDFGPEITFLTMHVYLCALLEVVNHYKGKVVDITGDGLMVMWGGRIARESEDNMVKVRAIQNAGLCGLDMLKVREKVINKIIEKEHLGTPINIGVGVTFDSVIVTKIGIDDSYDVKAFGDCINQASKYANKVFNKVKVSKKIRNEWPSGKNGKIHFSTSDGGESFIIEP